MNCEVCAHAGEHGSWPQELLNQGGTHCRDCHRSWFAKGEAHCAICHCHFSTNSTADKHTAYCSDDGETARRLAEARNKRGEPILVLRERKGGFVFVSPSRAGANRPW